MRYVSPLNDSEITTLQELFKFHPNHVIRRRGQALLLSNKKYSVPHLCDIFEVDYRTVIDWINRWENHGLGGLYDQTGRGRKPLLNKSEKKSRRNRKISPPKLEDEFAQNSGRSGEKV